MYLPRDAAQGEQSTRVLPEDARDVVARGIASAHALAAQALRAAKERVTELGHEIAACAVLVGEGMPTWSVDEILAVHFRMHKAEGELFRDALVRAADASGLRLVAIPEKRLDAHAEKCLSAPPATPGEADRGARPRSGRAVGEGPEAGRARSLDRPSQLVVSTNEAAVESRNGEESAIRPRLAPSRAARHRGTSVALAPPVARGGDGGENAMLNWALVFLVFALVAGFLGFTGLAATAAGIAKILFVVFLVLFLVSLVASRGPLRSPPL